MSLFDMKGKVAVITGSTKGIGLAIAERMAEHGAKVVIADSAPEGSVATERDDLWLSVAQSAAAKCDRCWHYRFDVGASSAHPTICGRCFKSMETKAKGCPTSEDHQIAGEMTDRREIQRQRGSLVHVTLSVPGSGSVAVSLSQDGGRRIFLRRSRSRGPPPGGGSSPCSRWPRRTTSSG